MKGRRNSNIFVLGAILLVVLSLTIGFAAFSTVLRIASGARILPPEKEWNVVFSSSNESYQTKPVVATKSSNAVTALDGVINNTENPTISNLEATFSDPGQTVTYDFYVYNMGRTDAFINSVTFKGTKNCTGANGVTGENTQAACDAISISVTVGDVTVTNSTLNMHQALAKKEFKPVRVVLSYAEGGSYPDESFDVVFPDISIYTDTDGNNEPYVRTLYSYGDRNHNQTYTDYNELVSSENKQYFIKYEVDESNNDVSKSVCLILNGNLGCFKNNNYDQEKSNLKTFFGSSNCTDTDDPYVFTWCQLDSFSCSADVEGNVRCGSNDGYQCDVGLDDAVDCFRGTELPSTGGTGN